MELLKWLTPFQRWVCNPLFECKWLNVSSKGKVLLWKLSNYLLMLPYTIFGGKEICGDLRTKANPEKELWRTSSLKSKLKSEMKIHWWKMTLFITLVSTNGRCKLWGCWIQLGYVHGPPYKRLVFSFLWWIPNIRQGWLWWSFKRRKWGSNLCLHWYGDNIKYFMGGTVWVTQRSLSCYPIWRYEASHQYGLHNWGGHYFFEMS